MSASSLQLLSARNGMIIAATPGLDEWGAAAAIMIGSTLAVVLLHQTVRSLERRLRMQEGSAALATRFVGTLFVLIGLVYAFRALGVQVGPLLGALGIGGILIAMSLQPVLGNLVGAILIRARRPIRRGDQIHSNDISGTVIDVNGRAVVLMTFDGERLHIPNLKVLDEPLLNQTANPHRRTLIPFQVSYEADLRHTQRVLVRALRSIDALADAPDPDVLATGFDESGMNMVARIWHPSEELSARWAISECAITIRETLASEGITIPYPHRVLYMGNATPRDPAEGQHLRGDVS